MNSFGDFLRSRFGLVAVGLTIILLVATFFSSCRSSNAPSPLPPPTNSTVALRLERDPGSIPSPKPASGSTTTNGPKKSVILTIDAPSIAETIPAPGTFAPAGSQLICELVNTLESIRIETPVLGLVVRDLVFGGEVIVPAGTKVFGKAQVDRVRERLSANGNWTIVFPAGEELIVEGLALQREEIVPGQKWGPDDGSAGFKGRVVKSSSLDELKLFASAFISGVSQGLQDTDSSVFGSTTRRSVKNATLAGSGAVLDEYAKSIAETIKRDGMYVRVDGGAQFTLFLPYFLDRAAARIGATRRTIKTP